ncbi:MAG: T9SS type A sorting domain-containing protein, partial [Salinibacter sp.]|uniref:T9SS type A sorting domain-containing protein n=1 Tax=Salinibacter sp. TaxID=2065818 RepID=UPI002FC35EF5
GPPTPENPWANPEAKHPFNVFNDLNHESPRTQDWLDRANEYWLTEFNVDGFRFDLSKGFTQGPNDQGYEDVGAWAGPDQERIDLLKRMADEIWSVDENAYIILEHFAAPDEEQELASYKVDQGQPGMMLWNNMNEPYSQAAQGYTEGSGLANTFYENRGLSVPNYITYMESHDEQWLMYRNRANGNSSGDGYDITELETGLERQKLVGSFFFTVPGPRMLWQFGELGYGYGDGGEQCLEGAGDECPSAAPGRTAPKPIRWDYRNPDQSPNRVALYKTWSALINLRQEHDVFTSPETNVRLRVGAETRGRRIELQHASMDAVVVGNFGVEPRDVSADFPSAGTWHDFFTGEAVQIEEKERNTAIPMAPGEFHIYTSAPVDTPEAGLVAYDAVAPPPSAPTSLEAAGDLDAGTADLSWAASTASDVTGYQVYRGTAAAFDTTGARIATVGPETTSYTDSTISQGTAKYYRVVARDNDGMRSAASAAARVLLRPSTVPVSASRSFGEGSAKSDYRLVALPGQVSRGVGSTLDGEAGEAWQVYWDDGSDEDYLQKFDGSSTFDFAPGRGFWAISESDWGVEDEFEPVSLSEDAGRQVAVVSLRQGWNIIANPLGIDVPWSRVENANDGSLQPLWRFDGSFRQTDTFASAREGEAFYFHNQEGRARLKIPYETGTQEQENTTASVQTETLLALTARGPEGAESTVRVGTSPSAKDGVGAEDVIAPPSQFESLSLRVRTEDEDASRRARSLTRSLQAPSGDEGTVHEVSLRAAPDTPVQLSVENMQAAGEAVRLVNRQTGASHNLRRTTSVELSPSEGERKWALLSGSEAFVEAEQSEIQPESLVLRPNYPNPFREQTTIEYTLPEADDVRIEVYDLLGRRVQTLVDGRRESGLHRATWNGRNSGGTTAASGLYIVRLQAGGTTRSQKATLVR